MFSDGCSGWFIVGIGWCVSAIKYLIQALGFPVIPLPSRDTLLQAHKPASKTDVVKARATAIRQWCDKNPCDVLHAHFVYMRGWSAALAKLHAEQSHTPLVMTLLGSDIYLPVRHYRSAFHLWRDKALNRFALQQADWITGASTDLCKQAKQMVGKQIPINWTPIGTDLRLFHPGHRSGPHGSATVQSLRGSLDISDSAYVVLSPRQVTPTYNIDVIIDAFADVVSKRLHPEMVLVLKDTVANTPERKAYVAKLKRQIKTLDIEPNVRWVTHVPFEQMPAFYAMADVAITIPKTDGFPVTLFEAMACLTPIITTDLPSYQPVVVAEESALIVPNRHGVVQSKDITQALVRLLNDKPLCSLLTKQGLDMVTTHGQFEHVMETVERRYRELSTSQKKSSWLSGKFFESLIRWT